MRVCFGGSKRPKHSLFSCETTRLSSLKVTLIQKQNILSEVQRHNKKEKKKKLSETGSEEGDCDCVYDFSICSCHIPRNDDGRLCNVLHGTIGEMQARVLYLFL